MAMPLVGAGLIGAGRAMWGRDWSALLAPGTAFVLVFAGTGVDLIDREAMKVASYTNLGGVMLEAERLDNVQRESPGIDVQHRVREEPGVVGGDALAMLRRFDR